MTAASTDYVGNLILKNGHPEMLRLDDGYVSFDSDTISGIHYYIQDYMGNNRVVVNRDGTIEQITHYYPYGGVIGDISTNESLQKFKFEDKELDRTFGLDNYDIHARQYFSMAPVWDRIDPMAEKDYAISPYVYCGGDPVNRGDYDGKLLETLWDAANVIMDINSCVSNISVGNWDAALVDAGALLLDCGATLIPFVPGGAGAVLKAERTVDKVVDATKATNKVSDAAKVADKVRDVENLKGPKANGGHTKTPHGGIVHDTAINDKVNVAKSNAATDIRKNQVQVDVNGNKVGNNRPDLQYNKDGVHYNVEFDTNKKQMQHHQQVVTQNDLNASNEFIYIGK